MLDVIPVTYLFVLMQSSNDREWLPQIEVTVPEEILKHEVGLQERQGPKRKKHQFSCSLPLFQRDQVFGGETVIPHQQMAISA